MPKNEDKEVLEESIENINDALSTTEVCNDQSLAPTIDSNSEALNASISIASPTKLQVNFFYIQSANCLNT